MKYCLNLPKKIENEIIDIVEEIKNVLNLSYATVALAMTSIIYFIEINDVLVNKKKLEKFKGNNITKYEYRQYTTEEIQKLLSICDERMKAPVLLMTSTGMRVGDLSFLKLKHFKKWTNPAFSYHVYQIFVSANSPKDRYFTFCTLEATKAVDNYLSLRERYGDDLDPYYYCIKTGSCTDAFLFCILN